MISVDQALNSILNLFSPLKSETVPLSQAAGRILSQPAIASRAQPPFAASAMDGYAIVKDDAKPGAVLQIIGESAAGTGSDQTVKSGHAIRIFTGAPVPPGADRIIIQEDVDRDGNTITLAQNLDKAPYIRPVGGDFKPGDRLESPRRLSPSDIALLAAMNVAEVSVTRKPIIALIATGDELVVPGETPREDQIISSNNFGLKALFEQAGATARLLPIAYDNAKSLQSVFDLAHGADAIITLGGASVGDHDLVAQVAQETGLSLSFYKVAMRPGKPLMAGRYRDTPMVGLPGNPVSSMVCGTIFLIPAINYMLGMARAALPRHSAILTHDLLQNGPREHYMRAKLGQNEGQTTCQAFDRQDSSLLHILSQADALIVRQPLDPPRRAGEPVEIIKLSGPFIKGD